MKKVNVKLPNKQWGTLKTKYPNTSDLVSYDELTNDSKNFDTTVEGIITKRPGGVNYNSTTFSTPPKDQYEAVFNDGAHHLLEVDNGTLRFSSGGGTFTSVTSGYSSLGNMEFAINQDRVYFGNGIDDPQVYDRTTSYGGVGYSAPMIKAMGAQAPGSAPSGAVVAGGNVPVGGHTYKVTFLYYDLEESNGGTATGTITTTVGNQTVNLSSLPVGGYGVTARKIYRDDVDGVYRLVGTVSNNTSTTFSDTASVGTALIPTDHDTPPSFKYVVSHLDRNWIAGIPGDPFAVYFSEAGLPNVFPSRNRLPCNPSDPITALFVYNDKVWALNRNSLGSVLGTTSDTFRYSALPSSVGCVDNRSIQIRTTNGIPTMVWLSSKGMYGTNGSSVVYLSDPIEDLINLNIQQANQVKGQNAQTSQSQFQGGTATPGIDLTSTPGTITTPNPKRLWDTEAEWEAGSSLTNISTNDGTNSIGVPTAYAPTFSTGTHSNTTEVSGTLRTPLSTDYTGDSISNDWDNTLGVGGSNALPGAYAQPIYLPRAGTIVQVTSSIATFNGNGQASLTIWEDAGGVPGSVIDSSMVTGITNNASDYTRVFNKAVSAGLYWFGWRIHPNNGGPNSGYDQIRAQGRQQQFGSYAAKGMRGDILVWDALTRLGPPAQTAFAIKTAVQFTSSPIATSGIWTSATWDTYSDSAVSASVEHSTTLPSGTSTITTVEASNVSDFSSGVVTQAFNNLNGSTATSLSGKRYWRLKLQLSTTDDRVTAQVAPVTLKFSTTGTWISEIIDHTTDITALSALSIVSSVPSGTSATVEIATSADNITYSPFTAIGSATALRYSKIRVTLTTNAGNTSTATVTSALFTWALSATLQSSGIDTGNVPAGWDIFQAQSAANGGTINLFFRTASTLGGLSSASYVSVTNGQFPTNSVLQFAQWKVVLTSTADSVPTVDSVTVNWFISITNSIRVASVFYNRSYYLAAAEYNQTTNNVVIVWDGEDNWRLYRGINANTLGYFFNDPYYGSSTEGRFIKFLQSTTDQGTNIEMIVDTKSMEFEDPEHTKILRKVYIRGTHTGAAYQVKYSLDGGNVFYNMIDEVTGLTTFTTNALTPNLSFYRRFIPDFTLGTPTAGKQILFRVYENSAYQVRFEGLKAEVWIRSGELIENADIA